MTHYDMGITQPKNAKRLAIIIALLLAGQMVHFATRASAEQQISTCQSIGCPGGTTVYCDAYYDSVIWRDCYGGPKNVK